jgi:hypothetical protein
LAQVCEQTFLDSHITPDEVIIENTSCRDDDIPSTISIGGKCEWPGIR